MKNQIIALLFPVITVFCCLGMENQRTINNADRFLNKKQKNKLIKKYSASTWQKDFQYAIAAISALTFPGEAYYKDVMDRQWWEKHKELIERGLDKEAINIIEDEFFKHKYKVTKRVGSCCMGLLITAVIVGLDQCLGLF